MPSLASAPHSPKGQRQVTSDTSSLHTQQREPPTLKVLCPSGRIFVARDAAPRSTRRLLSGRAEASLSGPRSPRPAWRSQAGGSWGAAWAARAPCKSWFQQSARDLPHGVPWAGRGRVLGAAWEPRDLREGTGGVQPPCPDLSPAPPSWPRCGLSHCQSSWPAGAARTEG